MAKKKKTDPSTNGHAETNGTPAPAPEHADIDPIHWPKLFELESRCEEKRREWKHLKNDTKEAKEIYEAAQDAVHELIRRIRDDKDAPLLNGVTQEPEQSEAWKDVRLDDPADGLRDLKKNTYQKFNDAELYTMGDLSTYLGDGKKHLTDIPGIGPAAATKIDDAIADFWARWNAKQAAAQQEQPGMDAADQGEACEPDGDIVDAEFEVRAIEHKPAEAPEGELAGAAS